MANLELNTFMTNEVPEQENSNKKPVIIGGVFAVILLIACVWFSSTLINNKQVELLNELQTRQEITVRGKADVVRTWLEETGQRSNLLTHNPLLRLFATEVHNSGGETLPGPLAAQLPYMQNAISQFVQENGLVAAYLVGKDGRAYLASSNSPALDEGQRTAAIDHYSVDQIGTTELRISGDNLIFNFLVPVFPAQANEDTGKKEVIGVFLMTVIANDHIANFLKSSSLSLEGEKTLLIQEAGNELFAVSAAGDAKLNKITSGNILVNPTELAPRNLDGESSAVYAVSAKVDGANWHLLQILPEDKALEELETYSYVIFGLAGSFFIVVISIVSGVWFSLKSQNAKEMADQYRELAQQINAQRRLLGSINNTVDDLISLKDADGKYVYANPAFAKFVDYPVQTINGKVDRDLFGDKVARTLSELEALVLETGETNNDIIEIEVNGEVKILRIEKSRLLDDNDDFMGVVTIAGDITDYITYQRKKEELGRKTISILVRMMEQNDPHLAGHSQKMSEISSNVADILKIDRDDKQNLLTGANLSQIGKISIPVEIRTKESRLTKAEMEVMQSHVSKADNLLHEMEIDEDIITAVTQMYERMDGTGYPKQLKGAEISQQASILGMADILVARVSPRTYRKAISVEEAMEVFRTNPEKYDAEIVSAFDQFLQSSDGQAFVTELESAAKEK